MAVLAPMPSASDRIATVAKRGLRRSPRRARRTSASSVDMLHLDGRAHWIVAVSVVSVRQEAVTETHSYFASAPTDSVTCTTAPSTLVGVVLAASYSPVRRVPPGGSSARLEGREALRW